MRLQEVGSSTAKSETIMDTRELGNVGELGNVVILWPHPERWNNSLGGFHTVVCRDGKIGYSQTVHSPVVNIHTALGNKIWGRAKVLGIATKGPLKARNRKEPSMLLDAKDREIGYLSQMRVLQEMYRGHNFWEAFTVPQIERIHSILDSWQKYFSYKKALCTNFHAHPKLLTLNSGIFNAGTVSRFEPGFAPCQLATLGLKPLILDETSYHTTA